jgi:hypothetical protein
MYLGTVETGNTVQIEATFIATRLAPTADSSDVIFTHVEPDGTSTDYDAPNAAITGPTLSTLDDGRHQSVWVLTLPTIDQPGRHTVRSRSKAGLLASQTDHFDVPAYVPLATA